MDFVVKEQYTVDDLRHIMTILRSEDGCPWDRLQTHESIRRNFIEETYEVVEAIDKQDPALLREELGDVLLQVVFHSQMEEEQSVFNFDDVVTDICKKLIVRHPHVFSDTRVSGVEDVLDNWSAIKQQTKGQTTASETLDSVPRQLPALMRAEKVAGRAKKANPVFGYVDGAAALADLTSEVAELQEAVSSKEVESIAGELGDVFFSAVNLARSYDLDPEELLTRSCDKFISRFTAVERLANEQGVSMKEADASFLDTLWNRVKEEEKK